jgi:hypothetical protein
VKLNVNVPSFVPFSGDTLSQLGPAPTRRNDRPYDLSRRFSPFLDLQDLGWCVGAHSRLHADGSRANGDRLLLCVRDTGDEERSETKHEKSGSEEQAGERVHGTSWFDKVFADSTTGAETEPNR